MVTYTTIEGHMRKIPVSIGHYVAEIENEKRVKWFVIERELITLPPPGSYIISGYNSRNWNWCVKITNICYEVDNHRAILRTEERTGLRTADFDKIVECMLKSGWNEEN